MYHSRGWLRSVQPPPINNLFKLTSQASLVVQPITWVLWIGSSSGGGDGPPVPPPSPPPPSRPRRDLSLLQAKCRERERKQQKTTDRLSGAFMCSTVRRRGDKGSAEVWSNSIISWETHFQRFLRDKQFRPVPQIFSGSFLFSANEMSLIRTGMLCEWAI